ncbi:transcription elongation factor GreA [Candidatus Amesbacteria bacterium RIFCSPLOWO2_01_FULL_49_25]|uniref:Transcription elongation factor GreA n=1 Tax=Candidatus Amesbacteria bacterium RIFCSPHIGHO2_01_FULL_48_32b TaxID=1797253 RepID=A0A1F4YEI8_9BACT|nr:MAG: transcription elongation factor GreA [Candidatus Amesbacteria bacterium RIFCSPHIGHO2_01_FULL_48_32b]OGD06870.1 MAG: transcription elongation factor GreA [Candidatus Amesbacteria bacterium RIFCSPLOWO2_01_FULL_49_25]
MNSHPILITAPGLDTLKRELGDLVNVKRPQLVDRLSNARSMGDLSENNDYQTAKEELAFIDGRISELEDLLQNAQVAKPSSKSAIEVGHTVTLTVNGKQTAFQIVGEWEADPGQKKVSPSSPLGKALMGRKVGEKVEVAAPAGKILYTIMAIE